MLVFGLPRRLFLLFSFKNYLLNDLREKEEKKTYSDGVVRNGGVGTVCCAPGSTEPGGRVKFNLFLDILLILGFFVFGFLIKIEGN